MWFTPSSTARRSTSMDRDLLAGTLSPDGSLPGSRIAPNPILLTVRSPSSHVPAAAALITGELIPTGYAAPSSGTGRLLPWQGEPGARHGRPDRVRAGAGQRRRDRGVPRRLGGPGLRAGGRAASARPVQQRRDASRDRADTAGGVP